MSEVVKRIREELGLDASVGIGPNKLVAKVASDAEKPRGFVVLTREQAAERFAGEPVGLIPGIGPKTSERLASEGVRTLGQLQRCTIAGPDRALRREPRPRPARALALPHRLAGDHRPRGEVALGRVDLRRRRPRARAEMEKIVAEQAVRLGGQLSERGIAGRTIAIKVRTNDFSTYTRARSIAAPTADGELIRDARPDAATREPARAPGAPARRPGRLVRRSSGAAGAPRRAEPPRRNRLKRAREGPAFVHLPGLGRVIAHSPPLSAAVHRPMSRSCYSGRSDSYSE